MHACLISDSPGIKGVCGGYFESCAYVKAYALFIINIPIVTV